MTSTAVTRSGTPQIVRSWPDDRCTHVRISSRLGFYELGRIIGCAALAHNCMARIEIREIRRRNLCRGHVKAQSAKMATENNIAKLVFPSIPDGPPYAHTAEALLTTGAPPRQGQRQGQRREALKKKSSLDVSIASTHSAFEFFTLSLQSGTSLCANNRNPTWHS